jgi:hypothetical protein
MLKDKMPRITIDITSEEKSVLEKRGKKNYLTLKEQIEDIIRRSIISYKKRNSTPKIKVDDKLVGIFSRQASGRKKRK